MKGDYSTKVLDSTVDQGYASDGVFLLLHLWAPSKWNEILSTPSSRICAMVMRIS
jgi:hypothetical protein